MLEGVFAPGVEGLLQQEEGVHGDHLSLGCASEEGRSSAWRKERAIQKLREFLPSDNKGNWGRGEEEGENNSSSKARAKMEEGLGGWGARLLPGAWGKKAGKPQREVNARCCSLSAWKMRVPNSLRGTNSSLGDSISQEQIMPYFKVQLFEFLEKMVYWA